MKEQIKIDLKDGFYALFKPSEKDAEKVEVWIHHEENNYTRFLFVRKLNNSMQAYDIAYGIEAELWDIVSDYDAYIGEHNESKKTKEIIKIDLADGFYVTFKPLDNDTDQSEVWLHHKDDDHAHFLFVRKVNDRQDAYDIAFDVNSYAWDYIDYFDVEIDEDTTGNN